VLEELFVVGYWVEGKGVIWIVFGECEVGFDYVFD